VKYILKKNYVALTTDESERKQVKYILKDTMLNKPPTKAVEVR
jgi:hypothetical protein